MLDCTANNCQDFDLMFMSKLGAVTFQKRIIAIGLHQVNTK